MIEKEYNIWYNPSIKIKLRRSKMGLFSLKETCVVCGKVADMTRSNTKIGAVCKPCMDILVKHGIHPLNIKKHSMEELRSLCGVYMNSAGEVSEEVTNLSAYEQLEKRIISNPSISLKEGEVCFYSGKAAAYHEKNVVTGRTSSGAGVSLRVAKGVSVRTGGGGSKNIRETIGESFEGTLYLTNFRIILLAPKYGFDVMIPKITSVSTRSDGLQLFEGSKCHSVLTSDVNKILSTIELMNRAMEEQPKEEVKKASSSKTTKNAAKEIREYKQLLDDGIITQEEFDAKKKQLLGL